MQSIVQSARSGHRRRGRHDLRLAVEPAIQHEGDGRCVFLGVRPKNPAGIGSRSNRNSAPVSDVRMAEYDLCIEASRHPIVASVQFHALERPHAVQTLHHAQTSSVRGLEETLMGEVSQVSGRGIALR